MSIIHAFLKYGDIVAAEEECHLGNLTKNLLPNYRKSMAREIMGSALICLRPQQIVIKSVEMKTFARILGFKDKETNFSKEVVQNNIFNRITWREHKIKRHLIPCGAQKTFSSHFSNLSQQKISKVGQNKNRNNHIHHKNITERIWNETVYGKRVRVIVGYRALRFTSTHKNNV